MSKYEIKLTLSTDSCLDPHQIIGEALEEYKKNHGIKVLSGLVAKVKKVYNDV